MICRCQLLPPSADELMRSHSLLLGHVIVLLLLLLRDLQSHRALPPGLKACAIRKLAEEAADNGALDPQIANGIRAVKGIRQEGTRSGNWLVKQQAQQLLDAPDVTTLKGLRDRAILALLLGCGLRRAEAAHLIAFNNEMDVGCWSILSGKETRSDRCRCPPRPRRL